MCTVCDTSLMCGEGKPDVGLAWLGCEGRLGWGHVCVLSIFPHRVGSESILNDNYLPEGSVGLLILALGLTTVMLIMKFPF